jgi:hypothetical protein
VRRSVFSAGGMPIDRVCDSFVFKDASRHPASKAMEKARLATFKTNGWWPHDAAKGHGASSAKVC